MSDVMLCGVLRMPFDDRGDTHLAQLKDRCHQAADELEKRADEIERLRAFTGEMEANLRERNERISKAAAFLDGLAEDADNATNSDELNKIAADCRAFAARLREPVAVQAEHPAQEQHEGERDQRPADD